MLGSFGAFGVWPRGMLLQGATAGGALLTAQALATSYFDGYEYLIGVTGKVRAIYDRKDPTRVHVLDQSDPAKQVALPAPHADYGGANCYAFTGAEWYTSNRTPAQWAYQSNGTGGSCFAVCTPTLANPRLCSTRVDTTGFMWGIQGGNNILGYITAAAAGVVNVGGVVTLSTPLQLGLSYKEGPSPEYYSKVTTRAVQTGDSAIAPAPGSPDSTLVFGAKPGGTLAYVGRAAILFFGLNLSAAEIATLQGALQSLTTVPP